MMLSLIKKGIINAPINDLINRLSVLSDSREGVSTRIALDYFESLDDVNQMKLLGLFELIGNTGEIRNKEKFGTRIVKYTHLNHSHIGFYASSTLDIRSL